MSIENQDDLMHRDGGYRQVVKTSDCGSDMRGFESHYPPHKNSDNFCYRNFYFECVGEFRRTQQTDRSVWVRARSEQRAWEVKFEQNLLKIQKKKNVTLVFQVFAGEFVTNLKHL